MKILFLSDYYSTWNIGGGSRVLATQIAALEGEREYEFALISGYPGDLKAENYNFEWIKYPYKQKGYLRNLFHAIKAYTQEHEVDVLHIHQPLIGLLAHYAAPKHIPRLYHFHSFWEEEKQVHAGDHFLKRKLSQFKGAIERFALSKMDRFIVLSQFSEQKLKAVFPEAVVQKISGSVEIRKGELTREVAEAPFKLLSVRRLEPRMGLDLLIRAVAELKERGEDVCLNIVGRGMEKENLDRLILELGLSDQVRLLGRLSELELQEALLTHHGMVIPTLTLEGFGMSVIEAFEAGLPVLATEVGGLAEFKKHEGVFWAVDKPDVSSLVEGISRVKNSWVDVQTCTKACRRVAESYYSHAAMTSSLLKEYRELS